MNLKKLCFALFAVVVTGAVMASSAFAANEYKETGGAWYVGGVKLAEGTTKTVEVSAANPPLKLETTVGGQKLDITAKIIRSGTTSVIKNVGSTATYDESSFKFEEVTVTEPAGCSTTTTISTKELTGVLGMNAGGTIATLKFTPTAGSTTAFATVELTGASCPIAGLYKVTGTVFAKALSATGSFANNQQIELSKAIQESAGTATSLKFGENPAFLTGTINNKLSPEASWGGKEK
jgi:hypothetical protein